MPRREQKKTDTSRARPLRRLTAVVAMLALLAASGPLLAHAAAPKTGKPKVATGGTSAARGTSATLLGSVDPDGFETSYYFQYGPTVAYGKQTTPGKLAAGTAKVKVGQAVVGILNGYHYRLVASNKEGLTVGKDRTFGATQTVKLKFKIAKSPAPTVFGGTYVLSGTLTGSGAGNRAISLQSSPYPFLEAFTTVPLAGHTDAAGRFSFSVPNLTKSTQYRVSTLDPRPLYSPIVTQDVAAKVILKVRSSGHPGLVRLYGTVTPAKPGARIFIQLFKKVRPGNSPKTEERTTKFTTQFTTVVKRGTATVSRFSVIAKITQGGSYRAYLKLTKKGTVVSGASRSVLLHAAPGSTGKH